MELKERIKLNLINALGWSTKRKIVIFESDDWGTIRVSSKNAYKGLLKKGYPLDKCTYGANDMLESNDDLERLFNVLKSFKDCKGNFTKFTINNIVANPIFEKIRASNFEEYFYESFILTLDRYSNHNMVLLKYRQAINENIIKPQFHGREHVHISNWMKSLQNKDKSSLDSFDYNMFTVSKGGNSNCRKEYLDAFATYNHQQLKEIEFILEDGMDIFERIWRFRSKTIIAPCYAWNSSIEKYFKQNGIESIQSGRVQKTIPLKSHKSRYKRKFTGQKSKIGMNYTIRNVNFEPSENHNHDWVNSCLDEIQNAFFWGKPAIIGTHRVNYIGGLNEKNSSESLKLLEQLLREILKQYPDVEFMTSDELSNLILKNEVCVE